MNRLIITATIMLTFPGMAIAADTATVRFGDLDVTSAPGMAQLKLRIDHAARTVCGEGSDDLASMVAAKRCRIAAASGALAQLDDRATVLASR